MVIRHYSDADHYDMGTMTMTATINQTAANGATTPVTVIGTIYRSLRVRQRTASQ